MRSRSVVLASSLLLAGSAVLAEEAPQSAPAPEAEAKKDPKLLDGMSILGNQEAPTALVIVPWKSSELGAAVGIAPLLDDTKGPVDREVFLRALSYYEIRSETRRDAAPVATSARRSQS